MTHTHNKNDYLYNKPEVLYFCLNPVLNCLIQQHPEAIPFHHPVDAELLKIPDYHVIVKHPMDLSTIREKLHKGQYEDGWEFVEDVWLMFENAWLYNKKTTRVYKYCSKLADLFKSIIDDPMKKLGYCCGQNYEFEPKLLFCSFKQDCIIPTFASYWNYKDRYHICKKCYSKAEGNFIMFQRSDETIFISKEDFVEKFNNVLKKEPFVKCINCGIKCHKICVLFLEDISNEGFFCKYCLTNLRKKIVPSKFTSENVKSDRNQSIHYINLQKTKLGFHIEERVNNFLNTKKCNSRVIIRLVCKGRKHVEVQKGAKSKYVETGIWPEKFPYTFKTLLAFQKVNCKDLCFFAMFVQEYDSECPQPNSRRVYISYLDSIHFFSPKELRTAVYHEILLGYLDYVRNLGFTTVHLWSCPSKDGEDFIFYCHPKEQKSPNIKKLINWYKAMIDKGIKEGIVKEYKDMYSQAVVDNLKSASELPYFDGDFLPAALEDEISELEGSVENVSCTLKKKTALSLIQEKNEINGLNESVNEILATKCRKTKKKMKSPRHSCYLSVGDPLTNKILQLLFKFKEVFLVIHLDHDLSAPELPLIYDPDPQLSCEIMSSREIYLEYCREKDNEFSSLRHALYSTMVLLYELHIGNDIFSCDHCKKNIQTGFHCVICKDFDLCSACYCLNGHDHKMKALRINAESKSYSTEDRPKQHLSYLSVDHLSYCNNANCQFPQCKQWKSFMEHFKLCKSRMTCQACLLYLQWIHRHSQNCKNNNCLVHLCKKIRMNCIKKSESKKFFDGCNICEILQSIHYQKSKERLLSGFCDASKLQFSIKKESSAFNFTSKKEKECIPSLLPNTSNTYMKKTAVICDQKWNENIPVLNNNVHIKSKPENMSMHSSESNEVATFQMKSETHHHQTLSTPNTHSYVSRNAMDPLLFSGKQTTNTKIPVIKHCSQSVVLLNINNTGNDNYPQNAVMPATKEIVKPASSLDRNSEHSVIDTQVISPLNIVNSKIEPLNKTLGNSNFTFPLYLNDNCVNFGAPNTYQNVSHLIATDCNQQHEMSCNNKVFLSPDKVISLTYLNNPSLHLQEFNSNPCDSQLINPQSHWKTSFGQQIGASVDFSEANSKKTEKFPVYSGNNNFTSMLHTIPSKHIPDTHEHDTKSLFYKKVPVSCHSDNAQTSVLDKAQLPYPQTFKYKGLSNFTEKNSKDFLFNTPTNGFCNPLKMKIEQSFEILKSESSVEPVDSSKVLTHDSMKSSVQCTDNNSSSLHNSTTAIFGNSRNTEKKTENMMVLGTREKISKNLNKQDTISKVKPQILHLKALKPTANLNKVLTSIFQHHVSSENVENIDHLISNPNEVASPLIHSKKRNFQEFCTNLQKSSLEDSSRLVENREKINFFINSNTTTSTKSKLTSDSYLNITSNANNRSCKNLAIADIKNYPLLAGVPKSFECRRNENCESRENVNFEPHAQSSSPIIYAPFTKEKNDIVISDLPKNALFKNHSKISNHVENSKNSVYPVDIYLTPNFQRRDSHLITSSTMLSENFTISPASSSETSSNLCITLPRNKSKIFGFIEKVNKNGSTLVESSQEFHAPDFFQSTATSSDIFPSTISQNFISSREMYLGTSKNTNTQTSFHVQNCNTISLTDDLPAMSSYSNKAASKITKEKEQNAVYTSKEDIACTFDNDINQNPFNVINSAVGESLVVTPPECQYSFNRNQDNQNFIPYDYHLNSAKNNHVKDFSDKSHEVSSQSIILENGLISAEQTFKSFSSKESRIYSIPNYSSNMNASFDIGKELKLKTHSSTLKPVVSKSLPFRGARTSAFNLPLNNPSAFLDVNANKQDHVNYNKNGNIPFNSCQTKLSYKAKISEQNLCKNSLTVCNNSGSYSHNQLSFEECSKAKKAVILFQHHQQSLTLLNNKTSYASSIIKQSNIKKSPIGKKGCSNKRGRKRKLEKNSNT